MHTCSVSSPQPRFLSSQCTRMPAFALKNNRSPWTAVLPPPFLWQSWWLTVGLIIPFSHHLLAVNQACHPGAIDRAVSLCETCLSKPLYTVVDRVTFFSLCSSSFLSPFPLFHFKYEVINNIWLVLQVNLESGMVFGLAIHIIIYISGYCIFAISLISVLPFDIPNGKTKSLSVLCG